MAGRLDPALVAGAGAGFCGALTTYSTLAADTLGLAERRAGARAALNVLLNVGVGVGAAAVGLAVGTVVR